jgi:hypothetical protein
MGGGGGEGQRRKEKHERWGEGKDIMLIERFLVVTWAW